MQLWKALFEYTDLLISLNKPLEVSGKLIEILKIYNSRLCQLVLGAGATALGKVKSISSSILGLTSKSLGFLLQEISLI